MREPVEFRAPGCHRPGGKGGAQGCPELPFSEGSFGFSEWGFLGGGFRALGDSRKGFQEGLGLYQGFKGLLSRFGPRVQP